MKYTPIYFKTSMTHTGNRNYTGRFSLKTQENQEGCLITASSSTQKGITLSASDFVSEFTRPISFHLGGTTTATCLTRSRAIWHRNLFVY